MFICRRLPICLSCEVLLEFQYEAVTVELLVSLIQHVTIIIIILIIIFIVMIIIIMIINIINSFL